MEDASSGVGQRHEDGACEAEIFLTRRRRAHVVEPDCTAATGDWGRRRAGDRSVWDMVCVWRGAPLCKSELWIGWSNVSCLTVVVFVCPAAEWEL